MTPLGQTSNTSFLCQIHLSNWFLTFQDGWLISLLVLDIEGDLIIVEFLLNEFNSEF